MSISSHSHIPRDLLQNFINATHLPGKLDENISQEDADLQLTLGLSLNGRFGVDPIANKLSRSSSIPDFLQPSTAVSHTHTCGTEKQRNSTALNGYNTRVNFDERHEDDDQKMLQGSLRDQSKDQILKGSVDSSFRMPEMVLHGKGADFMGDNENIDRVASQGSGSPGFSEFERLSEGSNKCSEARSLSTLQCAPDNGPKSPSIMTAPSSYSSNSSVSTLGNGQADPSVPGIRVNNLTRDVLMEMPCVSTLGDGPDGKRIEEFLYRYKKSEEVKIVCVCHGRFLSPAEFVKHAGGADVSNPLKHIVVNKSPFVQ